MTTPTPAVMHYNAPDELDDSSTGVAPEETEQARRGAGALLRDYSGRIYEAIPSRQRSWRTQMSPRLPLPDWMADRRIMVTAWVVAMVIITADERRLGYPLPRPARLWSASLLYGLLMVAGAVDPIAPIANLMAIGFTVELGIEFYGTTGPFEGITHQGEKTPAEGSGGIGGPGSGQLGPPAPGSGTSPAGPVR